MTYVSKTPTYASKTLVHDPALYIRKKINVNKWAIATKKVIFSSCKDIDFLMLSEFFRENAYSTESGLVINEKLKKNHLYTSYSNTKFKIK